MKNDQNNRLKTNITFIVLGVLCLLVIGNSSVRTQITFSAPTTAAVGDQPSAVAVGDFNRDGRADVATTGDTQDGGRAAVNRNTTFTATCSNTNFSGQSFNVGASNPRGFAAADFDRDGKLDFATANEGSNNLTIFHNNNGDGSFPFRAVYDVGDFPRDVTTADFNNDDKPDLAVPNARDDTVSVFLGTDQQGQFINAGVVSVGDFPNTITTGDFNGDGKLDIFAGDSFSGFVTLFFNTCVPNVAPVAVDDTYAGRQNMTLNIPAPGVQANDTDLENDLLTAILVTPQSVGTLTLNPNGSFAYTPPPTLRGTVSFTYKLSDGRLESNTATVSLTINNPPVAVPDSFSIPEDSGAVAIPVLINDSADPFETFSIIAVTQGASGAVVITNNGNGLTYQPNPEFFGNDMFTYTIRDSNGGLTATAPVLI